MRRTLQHIEVSLPELALLAGTRGLLGCGLGLLLADRLDVGRRRAVGWTLLLIGAFSTIPLAFEVFGSGRLSSAHPSTDVRSYPDRTDAWPDREEVRR